MHEFHFVYYENYVFFLFGKQTNIFIVFTDNLKNIGNHSLVLQAIVNDTDNKFAGRELPCLRINFSVIGNTWSIILIMCACVKYRMIFISFICFTYKYVFY